ncbi:MAG TPA: transporter [Vicinamibacterales bacterium]
MEPRAYAASPVGANFLVASYSVSSGGVLVDPTLPITDVHADVNGLALGIGHSFNFFGKLGLGTVAVPYAFLTATGNVGDQRGETSRAGLADARFKLSVNLRGNPAQSPREFARTPRRTVIGASLVVTAPASQYYPTRLVNVGTNRWAFKPEIGISIPKGRWDLDAYLGAWFFTANPDFFPGNVRRTQDPVASFQLHASYTIRPRLWVAADATGYRGGASHVGDGKPAVNLNNSRAGVTVSLPVGARYSIKVAYSSGVVVQTGTNFSTFAVGWQALWLSPRWSGR